MAGFSVSSNGDTPKGCSRTLTRPTSPAPAPTPRPATPAPRCSSATSSPRPSSGCASSRQSTQTGSLTWPIRPRRVVEHHREPPLPRRIPQPDRTTPRSGRPRCRTRSRPSSDDAHDDASRPPPLQPLRRRSIANPVLRATNRLTIRVAEIPQLPRKDQPRHTILREPARSPTRTPHRTRRNPPPPHRPPLLLIPVLHPAHRIPNPLPTHRRTEPLMPHHRHVLDPAQLAEPRPRSHPLRPRRPRTPTPRIAIDPIAVHRPEPEPGRSVQGARSRLSRST